MNVFIEITMTKLGIPILRSSIKFAHLSKFRQSQIRQNPESKISLVESYYNLNYSNLSKYENIRRIVFLYFTFSSQLATSRIEPKSLNTNHLK